MLMGIVALPIIYVACLVALLMRRQIGSVGISILCFVITFAAGTWAIMQSRSSTAAIGFVFVPVPASISGLFALGFGASRRSDSPTLRRLGLVALLAAVAPAAIELRGGRETVAKNARRDVDQTQRDEALTRHRARLDTILTAVGDNARDTLEALLRAHPDDRELVIAVLDRPQLSDATLDSFARSPDLGIALHAVQNAATSAATLSRVYRTHSNRMYFFQALAAHERTPPEILREIRNLRPAPITGLDIWFAGNPATPADVLLDVARTSESIDAVRRLLQHRALDCAMIEGVARGPAVRAHPDDVDVAKQIMILRAMHCR